MTNSNYTCKIHIFFLLRCVIDSSTSVCNIFAPHLHCYLISKNFPKPTLFTCWGTFINILLLLMCCSLKPCFFNQTINFCTSISFNIQPQLIFVTLTILKNLCSIQASMIIFVCVSTEYSSEL